MYVLKTAYLNDTILKKTIGNLEKSEDINYVWNSAGKMGLLLEADSPPRGGEQFIEYDRSLRAHVADLEKMHGELMAMLQAEVKAATDACTDAEEVKKELQEFAVDNICDQGEWKHGIALTPFPKFFLVTKFIKKYFPDYYTAANKIVFFKVPGTKAPPFVQIKKHKTCFFFKGRDGPGSVLVNPESNSH